MEKALLVGINAYPQSPLSGCVNDVANMANMLVQHYQFDQANIRLLVDRNATTKTILEALKWFVDVSPGDRCLFHFSGHGVQVPTRDWKQEIDGLDEVICPVDFTWEEDFLIRDKQLYRIFMALPDGVRFGWINDSCHSGDLTRTMSQNVENARTIKPPLDVVWDLQVAKSRFGCVGMSPDNNVVEINGKSVVNGILNVGFVSGCRSNQTSADTVINGLSCGALTYYLVKNLTKMPKETPLVQVVDATGAELASSGYSQRPQAEGQRKDLPFLG